MITRDDKINFDDYALRMLCLPSRPEQAALIDIETTGFRASSSHLYLIGAAFYSGKGWVIRQWLAENYLEEPLLLLSLSDFLKGKELLIHFNGTRFDIPYLQEKYQQYHLSSPMTDIRSKDLYLLFRPLAKRFGLRSMSQKALEEFSGICREDAFDGRQLIWVYSAYASGKDRSGEPLLLLHNKEDVEGMLHLAGLFALTNTLDGAFEVDSVTWGTDPQSSLRILQGLARPAIPWPGHLSSAADTGWASLSAKGSRLSVAIPLRTGIMYHYYRDYRNYYYLPREDMAIHKSVAQFVDKQFREKATASNCYIKKEGVFLPQPEEWHTPSFRADPDDTVSWFLSGTENEMSVSFLHDYIYRIILWILQNASLKRSW